LREIEALEALGDRVALENRRSRVAHLAVETKRFIEKMLEPNIMQLLGSKITVLPIPTRVINKLHAANVITIAELLRLNMDDWYNIRGLAGRSYYTIYCVLMDYGLDWELLRNPGRGN